MKKHAFFLVLAMFVITDAGAQKQKYNIYFGNTHAHCNYSGDIKISAEKQGRQLDPGNTAENHFRLAKENGYDFYFVTDHSQYPEFNAGSWTDTKAKADFYTDAGFVGMRGYEHSENDGPDGKGHMNVYNTPNYLNAMGEGVSIEYFHNWLELEENSKAVVCFNHPQTDGYNDFYCYNEAIRPRMAAIELINGMRPRFYPAFLNALSKGWKVSPVAGCDNHGWQGIAKWGGRTGVLAKELTPDAIIEAMAARRTYASLDKNLALSYYVNGKVMGSDIKPAKKYKFEINVSDPDTDNPSNAVTKIEIVGHDGKVVASKEFGVHDVTWKTTVPAGEDSYYFVLVYNGATESGPAAFAAPVWITK